MNGRVYDPKLGRMLSPDPVTQASENGQNYNRYTYANNNPLKYTDPSGFEFDDGQSSGGTEHGSSAGDIIYAIASIFDSIGGLFRNDGCDRTCKERHAALRWCEAQRGCANELYANTKKKFRRRSAQVIQDATETGQSYYFENGRAHLGDQTFDGLASGNAAVVGAAHYSRNKENDEYFKKIGLYDRKNLTLDEVRRAGVYGMKQASDIESQFHQNGEGNKDNIKFTSKVALEESAYQSGWSNRYGRYEIVLRPNEDGITYTHVLDSINMGTLNRGNNPLTHYYRDILPYQKYGNMPQ